MTRAVSSQARSFVYLGDVVISQARSFVYLGGGVFSAGTFVRVLKVGGIRRHVNCSLGQSFLHSHVRAGTLEDSAGTFIRVPRSLRRERARSINAHKGAMEATKQKLRDQQSETYAHSIVSQANATVLEITREAKRSVDQAKKVHWGSSP